MRESKRENKERRREGEKHTLAELLAFSINHHGKFVDSSTSQSILPAIKRKIKNMRKFNKKYKKRARGEGEILLCSTSTLWEHVLFQEDSTFVFPPPHNL